jgi:hypothetical protein
VRHNAPEEPKPVVDEFSYRVPSALSWMASVNRATRDKLVSGTAQADLTKGNACWGTAPLSFDTLNDAYGPHRARARNPLIHRELWDPDP